MKVIDSHIHLYSQPVLEKEFHISQEPVNELLSELSKKITNKNIDQALVYILDKDVLSMDMAIPNNLIISSTVDIDKSYGDDLEKAFSKGIKIIKLLVYDQAITRDKYSNVIKIAKLAQKKGMVLSICSTFGSKLLYHTNGVELAGFIREKVDIPIILAHGGGPKIFEAMSLSLEYKDIFLDLSFSLKYWWGSSVIRDYAFAVKKLESKRCFYGSDYPYLSFSESMEYFMKFIEEHGFSSQERDRMLHFNFTEFKKQYS